jgi:hypothetical protein
VNEYVNFSVSLHQTRRTVLGDAICNSLVGTGLVDLEFSLFKNVRLKRISEDVKAQSRVEFFNVLNHLNFASPNSNSQHPEPRWKRFPFEGALNLISTTRRQIQIALKFSS